MLKEHQGVNGPFLIVAPLSTVVNWQREISAWTQLDAIIYHGSQEERKLIREYEFHYSSRKKSDGYKLEVVITSPETLLAADNSTRSGGDAGNTKVCRELAKINWSMLVVDEVSFEFYLLILCDALKYNE